MKFMRFTLTGFMLLVTMAMTAQTMVKGVVTSADDGEPRGPAAASADGTLPAPTAARAVCMAHRVPTAPSARAERANASANHAGSLTTASKNTSSTERRCA